MDWIARLKEQGQFAARMSRELPQALADPALSLDEAVQLHRTVENCMMSFDAILEEMERTKLDAGFYDAAETVSQVWADLSVMAADKVRDMQVPRECRAAR